MSVTLTWRFSIVTALPETVPAQVDQIATHLLSLESPSLFDTSIGLDLAKLTVDIGVTCGSDDLDSAIATGITAIRTAIHAAGGSTSTWTASAPVPLDIAHYIHAELIAL